jgi:hypothetical protein
MATNAPRDRFPLSLPKSTSCKSSHIHPPICPAGARGGELEPWGGRARQNTRARGYALHTNQPVITEDTEREVRFEIPKLLIEHSVRSTVNVVIRGEEGPFGVLEVDSRQLREFEQDDIDFLQNYANLLKAEKLNASICFPLCPQQRTSTKHERHV